MTNEEIRKGIAETMAACGTSMLTLEPIQESLVAQFVGRAAMQDGAFLDSANKRVQENLARAIASGDEVEMFVACCAVLGLGTVSVRAGQQFVDAARRASDGE